MIITTLFIIDFVITCAISSHMEKLFRTSFLQLACTITAKISFDVYTTIPTIIVTFNNVCFIMAVAISNQ